MIKFTNIIKEAAIKEMTEGHIDVDILHRGMNWKFIIPVLKARRIWDKSDKGPEYEKWVSLTTDPHQTSNFGDCAIGWLYSSIDKDNDFIVVEYDEEFFRDNPDIMTYVNGCDMDGVFSSMAYSDSVSAYLDDFGLGKLGQAVDDHLCEMRRQDLDNWKEYDNRMDDISKEMDVAQIDERDHSYLENILQKLNIDIGSDDIDYVWDYIIYSLFTQEPNSDWLERNGYLEQRSEIIPYGSSPSEPFEFLEDVFLNAQEYALADSVTSFEEEQEVIARNGFKFKYNDICYIMVRNQSQYDTIIKEFELLEPWIILGNDMKRRTEVPDERPKDPVRNYHKKQVHFPFFKRGIEDND